MSQPEPLHYRRAPEEPAAPAEPRQDLGPLSVPVLGELDVSLGLGRSLRLALDRHALDVEFAGGVQVRGSDLPRVELRRLHVDLVDGVVETDADGLGPGFDRVLTVGLCSALRHTLGWKPGDSLVELGAGRLPAVGRGGARRVWTRAGSPKLGAALHPEAALSLELRGDALELELTRPLLLRVLGLSFALLTIRYVFAEQRLEVKPGTLGPLRQVLLRLGVWLANRWLRRRLPVMMSVHGYDLFGDPRRRAHVVELIENLRRKDMPEETGAEVHVHEVRSDPHRLARESAGGAASLLSAAKAALLGGLATLRVSADDPPAATRLLMTLPLGPFSSVGLATDRGGDVVLAKYPGGARLDAPKGLYLYLDQFPELAELRVVRAVAQLGADGVGLDVQTEPPMGPFLRALLRRSTHQYLVPRVPVERLRRGGLIAPPGPQEHHVLWRQPLGRDRALIVRTLAGASVELRHTERALELVAPAGLSVIFEGTGWLPAASARKISYRWEDGRIDVDGDPLLGEFGQAVLTAIVRARVAPFAPRGLGLRAEGGAQLDPAQLESRPVRVIDARLPLVGPLELRMDPDDLLSLELGRAGISATSERGLLLAAPELGKAIELRGACYGLQTGELAVTSDPQPGGYLLKLAAGALARFVLPRLRERLDLGAPADRTWTIGHVPGEALRRFGLGFDLSLPPGAALVARRTPDALELGATAPLRLSAGDDSALEVAIGRVRYDPRGERIELESTPPAGPLLHSIARALFDELAPKALLHALAERLGLPEPSPRAPLAPVPAAAPVFAPELPLVGPLTVTIDRDDIIDLVLRHGGADLDFGDGLVVRLPDAGVQVEVRRARVTFLPFEVELECDPPAGELEEALVAHVARTVLARALPLFWPSDRAGHADRDVLLSLGSGKPWGPLELCVPRGGALELHLDRAGAVMRARGGLTLAGEALRWLPEFRVRACAYEFGDGGLLLDVDGIVERHYRERDPVSPRTEALVAHVLRMLVLPHLPAWTQRLGVRILPPPPPLRPDPTHVAVFQAQLPGGYARVLATMDPTDVLTLRADRTEILVESERGLHVDIPGLHLRLQLRAARYHMLSGEVQALQFGRLENALAEAVIRHALALFEPAVETSDVSALATVLDRFPRDADGRRVLYDSKLARLSLEPDTALVVRIHEGGLSLAADPGIVIDGPGLMNYRFAGLRYSFDDAKFHLDLDKHGALAPLRRVLASEGEHQLDSLLRPFLPAAMRTPGYRLALDPDPRATVAALIRTVVGGGLLLAP
jgi:hypothetical protein